MKWLRRDSFWTFTVLVVLVGHTHVHLAHAELITFTVGTALAGGLAYYGRQLYCNNKECCDERSVPLNHHKLQSLLKANLFGQPIASEIHNIIKSFINQRDYQRRKALSISMHGWPGTGKNFVAEMIASSLYDLGLRSKFVKMYVGRYHFYEGYDRSKLLAEIEATVRSCKHALIIFDEVNDIPPGYLDALKPMLDYNREVNGVNYGNTIFIFMSNIKGNEVMERMLELNKPRQSYNFSDFEDILRRGSFNAEVGGFSKSSLIFNQVIDHYIPFLPLEQEHVLRCIKRDLIDYGIYNPTPELIERILSVITFGPEENPIFANAGCKRIRNQVLYYASKLKSARSDSVL